MCTRRGGGVIVYLITPRDVHLILTRFYLKTIMEAKLRGNKFRNDMTFHLNHTLFDEGNHEMLQLLCGVHSHFGPFGLKGMTNLSQTLEIDTKPRSSISCRMNA